ncbi:MAG: SGNH/GDSL hydrolase family protein [Armatimonadetes bacterium]|nr:SGNH/GDSL hydrolase family protein [Armatimonadota bacterium]
MHGTRKWYSLRWQVALTALALAGGAWHYAIGRFPHPVGSGPAGPPVGAAAFRRVWSRDRVRLVGVGDSITDGFGAAPGHGYFDLLVENDDAAYRDMAGRDLKHVFPRLEARNLAVSTTTSDQHLAWQVPRIERAPPGVRGIAVITSGGNDLIHDYGRKPPRDGAAYGCTYAQALAWKERYRERLRGILSGIAGKFPAGCELFVANVYDPTDGVGDIEHAHLLLPPWPDGFRVLTAFNAVIAEECAAFPRAHLVDIHAAFLGHGIHCRDRRNPYYRREDPHYWYFTNLEDPNERGYDAIRRVFLEEIVTMDHLQPE